MDKNKADVLSQNSTSRPMKYRSHTIQLHKY